MTEQELMLEVAQMYYEKNMTQQEIADSVFMSRSKISRLLQQARDENIVEVYIHYPFKRHQIVEAELKKRFNLEEVLISDSEGKVGREIYSALSMLAANYITRLLAPNMTVGITWGNTVYRVINEMTPLRPIPEMAVVTLSGFRYLNHKMAVDGSNLARSMAEKYGCQYRQIMAPMILENRQTRDSLLQMPSIKDTLFDANRIDMCFTNVGILSNWEDCIPKDELKNMKSQNIVGSVCGHMFDSEGKFVHLDYSDRLIVASENVFTRARYRIAINSDLYKTQALLAAIRGNLFNMLIVDTKVAYKLLSLDDMNE